MEEKNNIPAIPSNDIQPKAEINNLIREMIDKQNISLPAVSPHPSKTTADKTPLENLKGVLSHIDNTAISSGKQAVDQNKTEIQAPAITPANTIDSIGISPSENKKPGIFVSGPVAELEKLIKAHRAKSPSG